VEAIECGMTHADVIGVLSTVLHALGHAVFMVFGCQACCIRGSVGDCGHGMAWRRLCEAMEQQAKLGTHRHGDLAPRVVLGSK